MLTSHPDSVLSHVQLFLLSIVLLSLQTSVFQTAQMASFQVTPHALVYQTVQLAHTLITQPTHVQPPAPQCP